MYVFSWSKVGLIYSFLREVMVEGEWGILSVIMNLEENGIEG